MPVSNDDASPAGARAVPSAEWARRLSRGDTEAVHHVRARVGKILAYQGLKIRSQEREDLEQEIMTAVWQAVTRPGFDFAGGFWAFVEIVVSRRCIDWLRARREHSPAEEAPRDGRSDPLEQLLDRERARLAAEALSALDPTCQRLITLRLKEQMSYREIAREVGKSEGALRVQMYRCVRQVSATLKKRFGDPAGDAPHGEVDR